MPIRLETINPHLAHLRAPPRDRFDQGRAIREIVPLEEHAEVAQPKRRDPISTLTKQDKTRLQELVPLRYGRMSFSPFTFLRGAAAVMARDLAAGPRTNLWVELCGDAHLGNFRWYRAPDRKLIFDLNDFDETLPGPFDWDVKRLAASIVVAARNNGISNKKGGDAALAAVRNYREFIAEASELDPLKLYYYRFGSDAVMARVQRYGKKHREWKANVIERAFRKDSVRALKKLTKISNGQRKIIADPPRLTRIEDSLGKAEFGEVASFFESYRESLPFDRRILLDRFKLVDVARKVVGVGSVGTRCLILLLEAGDGTPLFLQFKQATASVLEAYLGKSVFTQAGQRVVEGQRVIQAASDIFLGWSRWKTNRGKQIDFYFRQLWDGKGKLAVEEMGANRLAIFAGLCGKTLAFAHARSGDPMMIRGYIGEDERFDDVMVQYARGYADQTALDHKELLEQIDDGAIEVQR